MKDPGAYGRAIGTANRAAVRAWFSTHLCGTAVECAAATGLNVCVVGRHVKAIRAEWSTPTESTE